ncbi:hypothetical protein [Candidatus Spongiihabitans sp.]
MPGPYYYWPGNDELGANWTMTSLPSSSPAGAKNRRNSIKKSIHCKS